MDPGAEEVSFMEDEMIRIKSNIKECSSPMMKELLAQEKISKNAELSLELRVQANKIFEKESHSSREHLQIWKLYSKSVASAPPLSKELSAALYNRSSLLYHLKKYPECFQDLTYAEECDCSEILKMKIVYRKADCSLKIKNSADIDFVEAAITKIQNFSLDDKIKNETITKIRKIHARAVYSSKYTEEEDGANKIFDVKFQEKIPCASTAVTLKYNEEFGRHVVATRYIKPGEILAVERVLPVLNQSSLYTHCSHCSKVTWASVPCGTCALAVYCSEKCKNDAWSEYHNIECKIIGFLDLGTGYGEIEAQSVRLTIRALEENNGSIPNLKKKLMDVDHCLDNRNRGFSPDGTFRSESCDSYLSLLSNAHKKPPSEREEVSKRAAKLVCYLALFTEIFGGKLSADDFVAISEREDVLFIGSLISRMYHMITSNQFTLAEQTDVNSRKSPSLMHDEARLGTIVAPFCSFINHACLLNVATCLTEDGRLIIFAVLPINKDSQIFKKYMNRIACDECPRDKRRRMMNELYYIPDCKCVACIEDLPTAHEAPKIFSITSDEQVLKLVLEINMQMNTFFRVDAESVSEMIMHCLEVMVKKSLYRCSDFYSLIDSMIYFFYLMHDRWFQIPSGCQK